MTQTLPPVTERSTFTPITERIPLAPDFPGTVYTAWSPRADQQSPDLRPPTDEFVVLSWMERDAEEAEPEAFAPFADWTDYQVGDHETVPVIDLAAVMPAPVQSRSARHRGKGRAAAPLPPWLVISLALIAGLAGGVLVLVVAVLLAGGPR